VRHEFRGSKIGNLEGASAAVTVGAWRVVREPKDVPALDVAVTVG
jgi:hypothetical protein